MKYIWEPSDIRVGSFARKPGEIKDGADLGWHAKWLYLIGYLAAGNPEKDYYSRMLKCGTRKEKEDYMEKNRADYCLISMADGMIYSPQTRVEIAARLNEDGMIPATLNDLYLIEKYCTNHF